MAIVQQEHKTDVLVKTSELMRAAGEALAAFKQRHELDAVDASVLQVLRRNVPIALSPPSV